MKTLNKEKEMFAIFLSIVVAIVKALGFAFLILPLVIIVMIMGRLKDVVMILGHGFELAIEWCDS